MMDFIEYFYYILNVFFIKIVGVDKLYILMVIWVLKVFVEYVLCKKGFYNNI